MTQFPSQLKQIARDMSRYEKRSAAAQFAFGRALGQAHLDRDSARREVCKLLAQLHGGTEKQHAMNRGWDCFKEDKQ